jgi:hypothetical protein
LPHCEIHFDITGLAIFSQTTASSQSWPFLYELCSVILCHIFEHNRHLNAHFSDYVLSCN